GRARSVRAAGAAWSDVDDPERLERPQRLADGRPSDLEAFREVALVRQARALGDLAGEDRVPNLQEHIVERPQAAGGRKGGQLAHLPSVARRCLVLPFVAVPTVMIYQSPRPPSLRAAAIAAVT